MRPLKLTISAFGPYVDETIIEMDKLGDKGLYLITGDTGAGKTTIFDAITFALYGEASGGNRKANMLRSKYSDSGTKTYVEMLFEYSGKIYKVKRNPKYERLSLRGDGMTSQIADAQLTFPDGRIETGLNKVTIAIKEIIGIDRNQFAQIAMIAQGDFLKLLIAKTEDRKEIFRQIFKTEPYKSLQEKLKSKSGAINTHREELNSSIKQYIKGVDCREDDVLSLDLDKAKSDNLPFVDTIELIQKLIEEDEKRKIALNKLIKGTEKELEGITKILSKAEENDKARKSLKENNEKLSDLIPQIEVLLNNLKLEKGKQEERDTLAKTVAVDKSKLHQYDELEKLKQNLEDKHKEFDGYIKEKGIQDQLLEKLKSELENNRIELDTFKNAGVNKEKLSSQLEIVIEKQKRITELNENLLQYRNTFSKFTKLQSEYTQSKQTTESLSKEYNEKNKAFLDEQAGVLAQNLQEGDKCPVCGSTSHPELASLTDFAPSEEELNNVKEDYDKSLETTTKLSKESGELKGKKESKFDECFNQAKDLFEINGFSELEEKIETNESEINKRIKDLTMKITNEKQKIERKSKLEELIPGKEMEYKKIETGISQIDKSILLAEQDTHNLTKNIKKLVGSLAFESKEKALNLISDNEKKIKDQLKKFNDAQQAYDNCKSQIDDLTGSVKALKKQLKDSKEINTEVELEKQVTLIVEKTKAAGVLTDVGSRINTNQSALENINEQKVNLIEVEVKWQWVKALSNTANGNISGKERIMLEAYIQMTYFDRILARANRRFKVMSGGQYELKRRVEATNLRSQGGLELNVIDYNNRSERSVETLSGGESFKASLSLALGLADEIQCSAGGIKLDTMFVDEGFGSLDEDSLNQAIQTLAGLTEGNRLVGIISHVSDLKDKIEKQIVVTKDRAGGSTVEIIS